MVNMSSALVSHEPKPIQISKGSQAPQSSSSSCIKIEEITEDEEKVVLELKDVEDEDFYTIEELKNMDNQTMAYMAKKFSNLRFRKNKPYKSKGQSSNFNKGGSSRVGGSGTKSGYKTGMLDRSKIRCYNCNELGHLARIGTSCYRIQKTQAVSEVGQRVWKSDK